MDLFRSKLKNVFLFLGVTDKWYREVYGSLPLNMRQNSFTINPVLIRPRSVGRIRLRTANFTDHPFIQMNYFDDPKDLKALVKGVRFVSKK
jgi:choline dehydrogenase-like flavoprotein